MSLDMNPEIRTQWVAALRSGRYEQGAGQLHRQGGELCCLGVLCELATAAGVVRRVDRGAYGIWYAEHSSDAGSANFLPGAVTAWAEVNGAGNPLVTVDFGNGRETLRLSELNDDRGCDFARIADAIDGGQPEAGEAA